MLKNQDGTVLTPRPWRRCRREGSSREPGPARCAPHPPRLPGLFLCLPRFLSSRPPTTPPASICCFQLCNLSFSVSFFSQFSDFRSTIWNMSSWSAGQVFTEGLQSSRACAGPWAPGELGTGVASVPRALTQPAGRAGPERGWPAA